MADYAPQFGYVPNPPATERYVGGLRFQSLTNDLPVLRLQARQKDTYLWLPLMACKPDWKRGAQAIGDCVSWGAELACTMLLAMQAVLGETEWQAEVATEAIYGLRCELDKQFCNLQDGWWGSGAAEAVQKWGVLLRQDYSQQTGNSEHDLTNYDGDRAKQWGRYGCGGKNDGGKLDAIAKQHPVKGVVPIKSVDEAAAAIESGSTVTIASDVGFGSMKRNSDGIVRRSGSWAHQMIFGGVRYKNGEPQLRCFQSWGKSCSGPDPGIEHPAISDCSWWVTADDANAIFRQDDSYAFARVEGFMQAPWDWEANFFA